MECPACASRPSSLCSRPARTFVRTAALATGGFVCIWACTCQRAMDVASAAPIR